VTDPISPATEAFAADHTTPFTGAVAAAAGWTSDHAPSPSMMAGVPEARLLEALIVAGGAQRVLEIGAFTGVGALAMAAALPEGGRVVTLEVDPDSAAVARRHFDASPYADRIELIVGDALETIAKLDGPFDLVWIDAWKSDYPAYFDAVLPKLAPRGVIAADNLFRPDAREFADRVQADARVHNVLLTVGDGVMLAWRAPGGP
jgi:caffeoyl-CoA O-methyltransferase